MSSPTADGGTLSSTRRRGEGLARWRRRSKLIHLYRLALPALIGLLCLMLAGFVAYSTIVGRLGGAKGDKGVSIRMIHPKFYGRTSADAPYLISAASAARDDNDFSRVILDQPVFVLALNTPTQSALRANSGVYREDTRILELSGDIRLVDSRGYQFQAQQAVIDTRTALVRGDSAIDGQGPLGQISASSYGVEDGGARLIFRGKVRSRIEQSPKAH